MLRALVLDQNPVRTRFEHWALLRILVRTITSTGALFAFSGVHQRQHRCGARGASSAPSTKVLQSLGTRTNHTIPLAILLTPSSWLGGELSQKIHEVRLSKIVHLFMTSFMDAALSGKFSFKLFFLLLFNQIAICFPSEGKNCFLSLSPLT